MIGLSLSFCIKEIINGEVNLEDVEKIIAGTNAHTRVEFEKMLMETYTNIYWKKNPKRALKIALDFWDNGKLDQPRTRGEEHPGISKGIWV